MVMESRHLLGVFLGVVVLCGVFFTLGYVMGRTQYDVSVRAAMKPNREKPAPDAAAKAEPKSSEPAIPSASEWTFPNAAEKKTPAAKLKPAPAPSTSATKTAAQPRPSPAKSISKALRPPLIPRGAIVLQVAALTRSGDALALAEALQKKEYPAFVLTPENDNLYRVQVGPYADTQSADQARRSLEREGFKTITKR